jgi:CDGSH-type Zn-finger protein
MTDPEIRARKNGPYVITGLATLHEEGGREVMLDQPTIALCRCGGSQGKPLCDGTPRKIAFEAAEIELHRT